MARQIIVLETVSNQGGQNVVNCVFWYAIGSANAQSPLPGFTSRASAVTGGNALTGAEIASLQGGATLEEYYQVSYPSSANVTAIKADLQARWTARNTVIQALPAARGNYGLSWDGTAWA